jgi:hypothetical protein
VDMLQDDSSQSDSYRQSTGHGVVLVVASVATTLMAIELEGSASPIAEIANRNKPFVRIFDEIQ